MFEHLRGLFTAIYTPPAKLLVRWGVSPDAITVIGTTGACASAFWLVPRGHLIAGASLVTVFALFDLLDGTMARLSQRTSQFGAFLDSTLDRIADAAIFGSVMIYLAGVSDSVWGLYATLFCLVSGLAVSYARAKAEALGVSARVGMMERTDRLAFLGLAAVPTQLLDSPEILTLCLTVLGVLTSITFCQRVYAVRKQLPEA